jgi:hypothetical protein
MLYVLCAFNFTKKPSVCRGEKTENKNVRIERSEKRRTIVNGQNGKKWTDKTEKNKEEKTESRNSRHVKKGEK